MHNGPWNKQHNIHPDSSKNNIGVKNEKTNKNNNRTISFSNNVFDNTVSAKNKTCMGGTTVKVSENIKLFSNILGFSSLLGAVCFSLKTFYTLLYCDYVITVEPNKTILITEFMLITYALIYLMFLMSQYFYNKLKKDIGD